MGLDGLRCMSSFGDDWASLSMGLTSGSLSSLLFCHRQWQLRKGFLMVDWYGAQVLGLHINRWLW